MKRHIGFLIIGFIFLVVFAGCEQEQTNSDVPVSPEKALTSSTPSTNGDPVSLAFSAQYIRTNRTRNSEAHYGETVIAITSFQQLQEYYSVNAKYFRFSDSLDSSIIFDDAIKKYDEAFFEKSMLAMVVSDEYSGSVRHLVKSVVKNVGGIGIHIKRTSGLTADVAAWHLIVELKKIAVSGNEFSFHAFITPER